MRKDLEAQFGVNGRCRRRVLVRVLWYVGLLKRPLTLADGLPGHHDRLEGSPFHRTFVTSRTGSRRWSITLSNEYRRTAIAVRLFSASGLSCAAQYFPASLVFSHTHLLNALRSGNLHELIHGHSSLLPLLGLRALGLGIALGLHSIGWFGQCSLPRGYRACR